MTWNRILKEIESLLHVSPPQSSYSSPPHLLISYGYEKLPEKCFFRTLWNPSEGDSFSIKCHHFIKCTLTCVWNQFVNSWATSKKSARSHRHLTTKLSSVQSWVRLDFCAGCNEGAFTWTRMGRTYGRPDITAVRGTKWVSVFLVYIHSWHLRWSFYPEKVI